ncbi:MAG: peptidoglycan-binding protein [Clostridiales bacterium]|nr:peptidoglycan-binding protein [Clostridiales bacterium]
MTPWVKKAKLHIITTVTVCGLVVAMIVPANKKESSAQVVGQQEPSINLDLTENELAKSVLETSNQLAQADTSSVANMMREAQVPQVASYNSNVTETDGVLSFKQETLNQNVLGQANDDQESSLLSMESSDENSAEETIGAVNPLEDESDKQNDMEEGSINEDGSENEEENAKEDEEPAPDFYQVGVTHSSVADIQQRLMDLGFMDYAEPTNYYGNITAEAVMMFQRQNDLKQDGIIGPDTKDMLMSADAKKYTAKLGMDGSDIKRIQTRLYEMGYLASSDQITGHFGDVTEAAVKKMQETNGLAADGKVGQMTVELIYSGEAKPNLISYGDKSDIVLACQKRLKELGYLTTTPDGTYGNDTSIAVKQFQSRNDLVVDGFLGPSTREALNSSNAVANGVMLGDNSEMVTRIQELLIKYGYLASENKTGYFGEVTESAVKAFQKANGLSADGNVGALTMAKLTGSNVVKASSSNSSTNSNSNSGQSNSDNSSSNKKPQNNSNSENSSSNSGTSSSSVSALISVAKSKCGAPYVLGAKGPNAFDCSGFVYWCLNQVGVKQSYITSSGWRNVGKYQKITKFSNIKAGDIVVVRGHVGIAAGGGMVIDASSSSGKIVYRELGSWWSSNFICAWRIFG